MSTKEKYWKYSLVTLILGLGALIVGELWAFVSGLLGAFTIFVLVRGQMITLTERWHWPRVLATVVVLIEVAVMILGPLTLIGWMTVERVQHINMDISGLQQMVDDIDRQIKRRFGYDLFTFDNLTMATGYMSRGVQYVIGQVSSMAVTLVVLVFFLYFILVDFRRIGPREGVFVVVDTEAGERVRVVVDDDGTAVAVRAFAPQERLNDAGYREERTSGRSCGRFRWRPARARSWPLTPPWESRDPPSGSWTWTIPARCTWRTGSLALRECGAPGPR